MSNVNITIEKAISKHVKCTLWEKGTNKRLYLKAGYNTKKCKQNIYIDLNTFTVVCYTDCPSQSYAWCQAENQKVIDMYAPHARLARIVAANAGGNVTLSEQISKIEIEAHNEELENEVVYGFVNTWKVTRVKINRYGKLSDRNRQFSRPVKCNKSTVTAKFTEISKDMYDVFVAYLGGKSEMMLKPHTDAPDFAAMARIMAQSN